MAGEESPFQVAINELEKDIVALERKRNGLVDAVNVLRDKAGLPPREPTGPNGGGGGSSASTDGAASTLRSDQFYGKRMGAAAREYLEMRKASGEGPAKPRAIYEALKAGGYEFRGKDESNQMVVLRTTLRKSPVFHKLPNGLWGLMAWYPAVKAAKDADQAAEDTETEATVEDAEAGESPAAEEDQSAAA